MSGNKTEAETFLDLFGVAPISTIYHTKAIENLASRLPGVKESNLAELLEINTTFPAYKPFIGLSKEPSRELDKVLSDVARVPRREGTRNGKAKICLACVQADLIECGYAYWHRAHHMYRALQRAGDTVKNFFNLALIALTLSIVKTDCYRG